MAPYVALNFQCYEVLKEYLIPIGDHSQGNIRKLFCGALAGSIAQTIIYPLGKPIFLNPTRTLLTQKKRCT